MERSREGLARRGAGLVAQHELFEVLHEIGVGEDAQVGVEASERITLARDGRILSRDPTPQTQLSWDHIYELFRAELPADRYRLGETAHSVTSSGTHATVALDDDAFREFDVVIGADGLRSTVRREVDPTHSANTYVGYVTWRGLIPETSLPPSAARPLLGRFAFYTAPGAHILGYLVPGSQGETQPGARRYNWVWYRGMTASELSALMIRVGRSADSVSTAPGELPAPLRDDLIRDARTELPGPFADAIEAEPSPFVQAIYDYVPRRVVHGRIALLGDAAAVVRPHTAMGAAKAAGDAMALARLLGRHPVSEALALYERERLPVARAIAAYGVRLGASIPLTRSVGPSR